MCSISCDRPCEIVCETLEQTEIISQAGNFTLFQATLFMQTSRRLMLQTKPATAVTVRFSLHDYCNQKNLLLWSYCHIWIKYKKQVHWKVSNNWTKRASARQLCNCVTNMKSIFNFQIWWLLSELVCSNTLNADICSLWSVIEILNTNIWDVKQRFHIMTRRENYWEYANQSTYKYTRSNIQNNMHAKLKLLKQYFYIEQLDESFSKRSWTSVTTIWNRLLVFSANAFDWSASDRHWFFQHLDALVGFSLLYSLLVSCTFFFSFFAVWRI